MLEGTLLVQKLNKTKTLFEKVAWYESFTPQLKTIILDYIRKDQLTARGVDEDNDIIGLYSRATELMSGGRKLEGDPFDLNDTGAFYSSMFITATFDSFIVDGDTAKMEESFSQTNGLWWHDGILGLNEESLGKLIKQIKEKYIKYVRKLLELD